MGRGRQRGRAVARAVVTGLDGPEVGRGPHWQRKGVSLCCSSSHRASGTWGGMSQRLQARYVRPARPEGKSEVDAGDFGVVCQKVKTVAGTAGRD